MPILGTVGIADKGNYSAAVTYKKGNFVYYEGSSWLALKDNLRGVTPEEGENWKYLARGFQAELLSAVLATDTSGLIGTAGEQVGAQALMDKVLDMIATKVMMKSDLVSQIVNDATKAASMAALYSVKKGLDDTNSNLSSILTPALIPGAIYQNNCASVSGGCMRIGKICFVCIRLRVLNPGISRAYITEFPIPYLGSTNFTSAPLSAYTADSGKQIIAIINGAGSLCLTAEANMDVIVGGAYITK